MPDLGAIATVSPPAHKGGAGVFTAGAVLSMSANDHSVWGSISTIIAGANIPVPRRIILPLVSSGPVVLFVDAVLRMWDPVYRVIALNGENRTYSVPGENRNYSP